MNPLAPPARAARTPRRTPPAAPRRTRRVPVYVVLPARTTMLDIAGPMEVLRVANNKQSAVRFDVHYVGASRTVETSIGLPLTRIAPLPASLPADAIVVQCGPIDCPALPAAADAPRANVTDESATVAWLRAHVRETHALLCICSGSLLAARAGLLDGRSCTTHFTDCAELARLAPAARVIENRLFVEDGNRYTCAGDSAGIDMMLHVVERVTDAATAMAVARSLVLYLRRCGSDPQLSPWLEGRNHLHPAVHRVQDAIAHDPARPWTSTGLARIAGASPRHLARLFQEQAGMSVTDYRNRLRVALARELLSQTSLDMERVAERAGFGSTRHLRRAWRQVHDGAPRDVRRSGTDQEREAS